MTTTGRIVTVNEVHDHEHEQAPAKELNPTQHILEAIHGMTQEQRLQVFKEIADRFCISCGSQSPCKCSG